VWFQLESARYEIIDQVLSVQEATFNSGVSNVVFMGMGELPLNFQAVLDAVQSPNQDAGIG